MSDEVTTDTDTPKTCAMCRFAAPFTFTPPANPDSQGNLYCSVGKAVMSVNPSHTCDKYKEPDRA